MAIAKVLGVCATTFALICLTSAHGVASHQKPIEVDPNADWATRHMAEEHHISNFDPGAFFSLHDFDGNGHWDSAEILKFYGVEHESNKDVTELRKHSVIDNIMEKMDTNDNGLVERDEWMAFCSHKGILPDFGLGPGHHWDMEMEYEIHHWEKYHDENTKEEDLTHPEDIEHFKLHDQLEDEADKQAKEDQLAIVEHNIPMKFRRDK